MDGSGTMGLEASGGGTDMEDGERVKSGDTKKLIKQNKELLRQNDQLNKLVCSLKNERDSLTVEKNKLKSDLKSAEKELKKVGSSLSVSRAELEKMKYHKLPKQHSTAAMEEVSELQQRIRQMETQLAEKNEKLGSLRRKLGSQVERLENHSRSMSSPELLESRDQRSATGSEGSLETKLQSEQETNARLRKENTELQTQIATLERDLQQIQQQQQQQQKDEEKGKKKGNPFKRTPSTSSLKEQQDVETVIPTTFSADTIAGAYSELSAHFTQHESPFFSPKNSPSLLHKNQNHMSLDLQACLKLSLEEKQVLEQERTSLKNDLKMMQSQLEKAQEVHSREKQDLLRQLQKAHTEREEMAREIEAVKLQNSLRTSSLKEKGVMTDTFKEEKKSAGKKLVTEQKLLQLNNGSSLPDNKRTSPGQLVHRRSASSTNEASRQHQPATKRLSWSADSRQLAQRRNSNPTATTPDKIAATRSEGSPMTTLEQGTEDNKPGENEKSSWPKTNTPTGKRTLLAEKGKERSRENFAAARAKFLGNRGAPQPDVPLRRERNSSSTSSTSTSEAAQSSVSTSSVNGFQHTSLENPQQATVVLGKPPVHPFSTSTQATRQSKTQEEPSSLPPPVSSKTTAKAKRMTWRVADRRKSFEEQSKDPPSSSSVSSYISKSASSPAMTRQSSSSLSSAVAEAECDAQKQRSLEVEEEKKQKAQSDREKRQQEEKNRREKQKREEEERERERKKEAERKKQQELEEKKKKELAERECLRKELAEKERLNKEKEEKERLKKEKEEKERQRKEAEEKRRGELEEKKKRDAEERERVRKEMEEKQKRTAEEKKAREAEEKERRKREREEKEKQWKEELEEKERRRKEEAEKQKQIEQLKRQEQEKEKQLQMQREQEKQAAAVKRQEEEERQKQLKKEREQQLKRDQEEREKKNEDTNQTSFSSVAQRRQAFEQKSPNTSPTAVVLRRNISTPPVQHPKSMDYSLVPNGTLTSSSTTPPLQNGSSKLSSISVKTSKSPVSSSLLNQRKEIKEIAVQKSITKPPPPASLTGRSSTVAIVTTSSSPPLCRAHTFSTGPTWKGSLASSTPDLTNVVSSNGSTSSTSGSSSGGGGGWSAATKTSPLVQRRNPPSPGTPTELWTPSNPLRSPVAEKKTKSVSFSPVASTAGGSGVSNSKHAPPTCTSKPAPPSCTSTPSAGMQPEKLIFKASPAKLSLPESSDMKRATSLQNIPENSPTSTTVQALMFTVGGTTAPRVNRLPRSERPNTTSLSRADTMNLVNLISKMQGKQTGPGLGDKAGLGSGLGGGSGGGSTSSLSSSSNLSRSSSNVSSTSSSVGPRGGTALNRPMSMYGTTSPSR